MNMEHRCSLQSLSELPCAVEPADFAVQPGRYLAHAYEKDGPVLKLKRYTGEEQIYLVGPDANRLVLSQTRKFSHYEGWSRTDTVIDALGCGVIFMDGAPYLESRRTISPVFADRNHDFYLDQMSRIIQDRLDTWPSSGIVDVWEEAYRITFEIAATVIAGVDRGQQANDLCGLFHELTSLNLKGVTTEDPVPAVAGRQRREEIRNEIFRLLQPALERRKVQASPDLLGRLVNAKHTDGTAFSPAEIVAHVNSILLAGHITASSLCAFLLHLLVENPGYHARVLAELDALSHHEAWTREELETLRALDNALLEAERMYPPVASLPRAVMEEFDFGGFHFPPGVVIHCSIVGAHYISTIFASPHLFDPDRFASPREEHKATPFSLVGFSAGLRRCMGMSVARMEIKSIVSHILRRFRLEPVEGTRTVPLYHPVCTPAYGIRMRVSAKVPSGHADQSANTAIHPRIIGSEDD